MQGCIQILTQVVSLEKPGAWKKEIAKASLERLKQLIQVLASNRGFWDIILLEWSLWPLEQCEEIKNVQVAQGPKDQSIMIVQVKYL